MVNENLISDCKKMHHDAQRQVYELMAPKLHRTCKRYLKKEEEIEEALADAFYTIFTKLDQLKEFGAFEAWSRTIIVWRPSRKTPISICIWMMSKPFRNLLPTK